MFSTEEKNNLTSEHFQKGYIVRPVADHETLDWPRRKFINLTS